jgi:hypothetical protein
MFGRPSCRLSRSDSEGALPVGDEVALKQTSPASVPAVQQQRTPKKMPGTLNPRLSDLRRNSEKDLADRNASLGLANSNARKDSLSRIVVERANSLLHDGASKRFSRDLRRDSDAGPEQRKSISPSGTQSRRKSSLFGRADSRKDMIERTSRRDSEGELPVDYEAALNQTPPVSTLTVLQQRKPRCMPSRNSEDMSGRVSRADSESALPVDDNTK